MPDTANSIINPTANLTAGSKPTLDLNPNLTAHQIANHLDKRQIIMAAGAQLFAENGFSRTSVDNIAKASKMSKGNVFHYFANKESLLFAILHDHLSEVLEKLQHTFDTHNKQLYPLVLCLLSSYQNTDNIHKVLLNDLMVLPGQQQTQIVDTEHQIMMLFKQSLLFECPQLSNQPQNISPAVMTLLGSLNWTFTWFKQIGQMSLEDYAKLVVNTYLNGLKNAPP